MELTIFQYRIIAALADSKPLRPYELATALNVTGVQLSRNLKILKTNLIVEKNGTGRIMLARTGIAGVISQLLQDHPGVEDALAGKGLLLLQQLTRPRALKELAQATSLSKNSVYRLIRGLRLRGIITKKKKFYEPNYLLWPDMRLLIDLTRVYEGSESEIPGGAKIFYKDKTKTIFSSRIPVDASPTAFSKYSDYGLTLFEKEYTFRLPKSNLTLRDVFVDSLECLTSIRRKILCILFYVKYGKKLKGITHSELEILKNVLKGEHIPEYPTLAEIKQKADVYDIKL